MAKKVLFLCTHNSARSQIAEALLKKYGEDRFIVESAGFQGDKILPLAINVLAEEGIDISDKKPNDIFEFFKQGRQYNYVITVCDSARAKQCPIFPGLDARIHWDFDDPRDFTGDEIQKMAQMRILKDGIKEEVLRLIELHEGEGLKERLPKHWILQQ